MLLFSVRAPPVVFPPKWLCFIKRSLDSHGLQYTYVGQNPSPSIILLSLTWTLAFANSVPFRLLSNTFNSVGITPPLLQIVHYLFLVYILCNTNKPLRGVLISRWNTLPSVWYSISNKSVFKKKIEMKVGLILCKCFITYPNSVSVLISFVFSSWIINEFEITKSHRSLSQRE